MGTAVHSPLGTMQSPADRQRRPRWIGVARRAGRSAAFGVALVGALGCSNEPPRNLMETGEVFEQVRLSKVAAEHHPSSLRIGRPRRGGLAWEAGFRDGDYILSVNDIAVTSYPDGIRILSEVDASAPVVIEVKRGREAMKIEFSVRSKRAYDVEPPVPLRTRIRGGILSLLASISELTADRSEKPNIILLIGDDHGYPYFGFTGSEHVLTPNLDRLAEEGTVFSLGHTTASICRASLRTLLTGLHPYQFNRRLTELVEKGVKVEPGYEIEHFQTLPRLLAQKGYVSFQGGKYWEGNYKLAGFTEGMSKRTLSPGQSKNVYEAAGGNSLLFGRVTMQPLERFLHDHGHPRRRGTPGLSVEPFYVWFAPMLPHEPFNAPKELLDLYEGKGYSAGAVRYYANCTWFDVLVGKLLRMLEKEGLRENTLLIYVSDNGWEQEPFFDHPSDLGGARGKLSMHDLGFRTPLLFNWPGHVRAGQVIDELVSTVDLVPTILDYAGVPVPDELDGQSLRTLIEGKTGSIRDDIVGSMSFLRGSTSRFAARQGYYVRTREWHYIWYPKGDIHELYNMQGNSRNNLVGNYPDLAKRFRARIESWSGFQ